LAVQWRLQKIDARYSFIVKIIISMQVWTKATDIYIYIYIYVY
jgi:hypothetical protein